jgi:uncharacterized protein (DUF697 family)
MAALSAYETKAAEELERWQSGDESWLRQMFDTAMRPVDWATEQVIPAQTLNQADAAVAKFFAVLGSATKWSVSMDAVLKNASEHGIEVTDVSHLREIDLERLDPAARALIRPNTIAAAVEGGGAGLGGIALMAADIPALFAINLRLIQQIAASYGFDLRSPEYQSLIIAVLNVAACGTAAARHQALREMSVAGSAFASGARYLGHVSGSYAAQNRNLPREIAKQILGRKLGQLVPLAGAAVGAGVNYWFTSQTAEAAFMAMRALSIECRRRAP